MRVSRPSARLAARSPWPRAAAAATAALYLSLTYSALACALHHGLTANCLHHGAVGTMAHPMGSGTPMGNGATASDHAHAALCHCLDNLAADTPASLRADVLPPPLLPQAEASVVPARAVPVGSVAPRGPPAALPA
jgi:hypothetical protein